MGEGMKGGSGPGFQIRLEWKPGEHDRDFGVQLKSSGHPPRINWWKRVLWHLDHCLVSHLCEAGKWKGRQLP